MNDDAGTRRTQGWDSSFFSATGLKLSASFPYEWFLDVQNRLSIHIRNEHTLHIIMSNVLLVVQQLSQSSITVEDAVTRIVTTKIQTCARSIAQIVRRLYWTVNLVWFELLGELKEPLKPWRCMRYPAVITADTKNVFPAADVEAMYRVAPSVSVYADAFLRLLFTTGLRIAAVARLLWSNVLSDDGSTVRSLVQVWEKGNQPRWLVLASEVRTALLTLLPHRNARTIQSGRTEPNACPAHRQRVFPLSRACSHRTRVRRGYAGYAKCATCSTKFVPAPASPKSRYRPDAWKRGPPLPSPHGATHGRGSHFPCPAHPVVHRLFAAGNSVALIAKFMGHRTVQTTNQYYLKLSFAEIMSQSGVGSPPLRFPDQIALVYVRLSGIECKERHAANHPHHQSAIERCAAQRCGVPPVGSARKRRRAGVPCHHQTR